MEQVISNLFPNGIRALVVDDDARFLTSSSMMLSTLNFKVDTCRSLASALRLLNQEKIKDDIDAVLVNAEKAAACSFDFHGIVESIMCTPVLYFLPLEVTGYEATLLRPGANTIKKPLDANEVCNLWRGIARRKCSLRAKAAEQAGGRRVLHDAVVEALLAGGRGRKRKSSSNPGGSSGTSSLAGNQAAMRQQQQMNLTEGQQAMHSLQPRAMNGRQPGLQQQSLFVQSVLRTLDVPPYNPRIYADTAGLSVNGGAGAGNTGALAPALATTPPVNRSPVPAPAPPRPVYPADRNVFGATAPSAAVVATMAAGGRPPLTSRPFSAPYLGPPPRIVQQDMSALGTRGGAGTRRRETEPIVLNFQQPPGGDVFTSMASGAVMTFGASASAAAAATAHAGAYGNSGCSLLQSLNTAADGHDELSAMVTMKTGTNSNPPLAPHHARAASNEPMMDPGLYGNNYCYRSLIAPRLVDHHVHVAPANQSAAAAMGTLGSDGYINYSTASTMEPLQAADHGVAVAAGMEEEEALDVNNFSSYSSALPLAPDHEVLGMASNVNELTISGGASFGDDDPAAASFTASQDLVAAAPNGDQFAPGALDLDDDDLSGWAMGSRQGPEMAMDGDTSFIDHRVAPSNQAAGAMGTLGSDGYIDYSTASAMAPLQVQADHGVAAGMEEEALDTNTFSSYSSASSLASDHQILGIASNVNELTMSGGASFGDDAAAASFTASRNLVAAAPNGDQFAPGALDLDDDDLSGWIMGSHQGPDMAMDGDAGFVAMSPADQYPASTIFSMDELLSPDDQQGGAAADAAAGSSLIGGEGSNGTLDIGAVGNLDGDFILGNLWDFRAQPYDV